MQHLSHFYINGKWINPVSTTSTIKVINPSTEEIYAELSIGNQEDANLAIKAAKDAYPQWSETTPKERLKYVEKILQLYINYSEEMAVSISTEMGAPIDFARNSQVLSGRRNIENFIAAFKTFHFEHPAIVDNKAEYGTISYSPIGVCCLITPWNWPINQITKKVIPALLAGCTTILKPSELAPLSANLFAKICHEASLPAGVFNMVHGLGPHIGAALTSHRDVDMISFTGSTRAGKQISEVTARDLKKVTLELGGKGANIIFADSDNEAVKRGVLRCFVNSGQSCNSPTRMLIERSIYDKALQQAREAAENIQVDIASNSGKHIGPVISQGQFDKIQNYIQSGIDEGATLITGGLNKVENFPKGYFVKPTIFANVQPNMKIFKEEIFGPVLSITPFDTEEEAITLANDTEYGLTNYIQTSDKNKAMRVAKKLRSGMVEINGQHFPAGSFFGGVKLSGRAREGGLWGIKEYLDNKIITDFSLH